jgi:hypothetical protein
VPEEVAVTASFDSNTALRSFFNSLTAQKIVTMKGHQQEHHALEFKQVMAPLSDKDKENFGRSVSGFANAGGGVIIWGVDARPDGEGVDRVTNTPGVTKPELVRSQLSDLTGLAVAPVVPGVEHRVIRGRRNPSFVASLIPESDGGPHMCMLGGSTFRYYIRSTGSFTPMQHVQVADMFGRRARAVLDLEVLRGPNAYQYFLRVTNSGRGAAQAPFLEFSVDPPFSRRSITGGNVFGLPWVTSHRGVNFLHAGGMDAIIHPTMFIDVCAVSLGQDNFPQRVKLLGTHCIIEYKLGALGIPPKAARIEIPLSK